MRVFEVKTVFHFHDLSFPPQIAYRRLQWECVQPKAPQGYKDYLLVNGNYVLEGNSASRLAAPMVRKHLMIKKKNIPS